MERESKSILVVDDEVLILESIKSQLERLGNHQVTILLADSEEEAHEIIDGYHASGKSIDALISDFRLPQGSPDAIITHFKLCFATNAVYVLTGMPENHPDIQALQKRHSLKVIHKPWSPEELLSVLTL